jgi:hypothetical protein
MNRYLIRTLLVLLLLGVNIQTLYAQLPKPPVNTVLEAKIKAAYLFNFTKFVHWPNRQEGIIGICIIGAPHIAKILNELSKTKPFYVVTKPGPKYELCQILYIDSAVDDFENTLSVVQNKQVLTVSDYEMFTHRGGMIGFFSDKGRVRLEININSARANDIKISSKLLELSRIVELSK